MTLASHLRKEVLQAKADPWGLFAATMTPILVVAVYSRLHIGPRQFSDDFRDTHPLALILCLSIWLSSTMSTSQAILQERASGTYQRLSVTPFDVGQAIIAKAITFGVIGLLQVTLAVGAVLLLVPGEAGPGEVWGWAPALAFFSFAALACGLLLSAVSSSTTQVAQAITLLTLASIAFSGFLRPLSDLGEWAGWALGLPFTLAYNSVRAGFAGSPSWMGIAALAWESLSFILLGTAATLRSMKRSP